jgi:hypothetical protein
VFGLPGPELLGIDRRSERAAGGEIGSRTVFCGDRIAAVSAMKCTPQKTMTSAVGLRRLAREAERVADEVGDVLHLGRS